MYNFVGDLLITISWFIMAATSVWQLISIAKFRKMQKARNDLIADQINTIEHQRTIIDAQREVIEKEKAKFDQVLNDFIAK